MRLTSSSQHSSKHHFLGLDGLRGIAAFVVVFLHGTMTFDVGYIPGAACLAVDFFFLLSGFVIAYAYDERLGRDGMTWRQFMAARVIRLYPMLFIGTALGGLVFMLVQVHKHEFDIASSFLMIAGSFALIPVGLAMGTVAYPVNLPAWSLFFEFVANTLYGSRFGKLSTRRLAAFITVAGVALVPMAIWGGRYLDIGFQTPAKFLLGFVRVSYPFWAGVFLFRVAHVRKMPSIPISMIGFFLMSLLLAPFDGPAYNLLLDLVLFPVLVALAARASFGALTARACSALGRLSYPLYLVHLPVYRLIHGTTEAMPLGISPWVMLIGGAILSVILAEALLIAFDEPVRRWLGRKLRSRYSRAGYSTAQPGVFVRR